MRIIFNSEKFAVKLNLADKIHKIYAKFIIFGAKFALFVNFALNLKGEIRA
ncbi:hypothetical protein OFO10_06560 [Campylobacter sp. VBCF_06 NA8]|uniref:hypothetical protein n=1 Tax=unclassified Campylobacter TaxID=2593542 RepID=UPI001B550EAF|nr:MULTISPECIES: hypothetical protein [unclassified Campylobacter]MBP3225121.1 hypothetical protein [Campylobacter sp.]MDA3046815.1 hypothetical protein [Campylobacter sp. VBCF_06 NA8]MDA3048566.1 hypothetical protein [Campylobacter sp. JMF_08 NE1]